MSERAPNDDHPKGTERRGKRESSIFRKGEGRLNTMEKADAERRPREGGQLRIDGDCCGCHHRYGVVPSARAF